MKRRYGQCFGSGTRYLLPLLGILLASAALAVENDDCFDCHDDPEFEGERNGKTILLHVDPEIFEASVHSGLDCIDCHQDVEDEDHDEELELVYCGDCHDDVQLEFDSSVHGQALARDAAYAPRCSDCHGTHEIQSPSDPSSVAYKMNIPYLCGECHKEGAPVSRTYDISEHNIIDNYSQSIHGEGLFKKGLTVTATCTSCHRSHRILPHTDPNASIAPRNIARTCMACHSRIEDVHEKVIRGELWESRPGSIPACTDCHLPHKVRKETVAVTLSDRDCLACHDNADVYQVVNGDTLSVSVDAVELDGSIHRKMPCVQCHSDVNPRLERPCEPAGRVECSSCHDKITEEYYASGHGIAWLEKSPQAPYCTTCHGDHGIRAHYDDRSPTHRAAVPSLCGDCHQEGGKATEDHLEGQYSALTDYSTSVHGRGLTEKGLLPSAICIDCHGAHLVLESEDERSTVNEANLPTTCANCHDGIYKQYIKSVHFKGDGDEASENLPTCADCHSSHTIQQVGGDAFMHEVTELCGSCHTELAETYLETMHGKAYHLGYLEAAKCSDCHGAHGIRATNDPESSVGFRNIVGTCQQCHEDANARFTGYLTHATHHDEEKYPVLYYTYWAMTLLLVGVFSFFGIHTLLWLPRSFRHMLQRMKSRRENGQDGTNGTNGTNGTYYIRRFTRIQRVNHLLVIVSFLSLALTGMILKFSAQPWATWLADALGGVRAAGSIHRAAAIVTFGYFALHIWTLARLKKKNRMSMKELILGKNSMMFNLKDIKDFGGTMKWFFGKGPRPDYGRWTYWEKFDYLAVFWGVAVIGLSGLMLWFPEFFTKLLPGVLINVATIVHSDEALLAAGFIFTIHFFNTHLRPEAFPMDTVVFTGLTPLEHYKHDRPHDYEAMRASGELRKRVVRTTIPKTKSMVIRVFGYTFLGVGLVLVGLIVYSVLFGYH